MQLSSSLPHALWRGDALGSHAASAISTGFARLNRELPGGGWPASALTELLWTQQGGGEFRLLGPALADLSRQGKSIILLAPPHLVFAPALAQAGIDIGQVLLVQSDRPADRLWAVEQILKSAQSGALLCWLPQARPEHLRRLQLAANNGDGLTFVFRPAAAQMEPSPAPLRLLCEAAPCGRIAVEVIKRRGPAASGPIILQPVLPPVMERALNEGRAADSSSAIFPAEPAHVMDRPLPASVAAGSRLASLA
jgi:protein ImuA